MVRGTWLLVGLILPFAQAQRIDVSAFGLEGAIPTVAAAGRNGEVYVAGIIQPRDEGFAVPTDAFVAKLSSGGERLLYRVVLGGSANDWVSGLAVDAAGNAYLTGNTESADFPTSPGALLSHGKNGPYAVKIGPAGDLVYSTYLFPAEAAIDAKALVVDRDGNAIIAGNSRLLVPPPERPGDVVVTKLNATGSRALWTSYWATNGALVNAMAADSENNLYLGGYTHSDRFPVTAGAFQRERRGGTCRGFGLFAMSYPCPSGIVAKLSPDATRVLYATYLGGTNAAFIHAIAVDREGNAHVAGDVRGYPAADDFPVTEGAFQTTLGLKRDAFEPMAAFVAKFSAAGDRLLYSTYLTGEQSDTPNRIAVDVTGAAIVTGIAKSPDFPVTGAWTNGCGFRTLANTPRYGFVTRLNSSGSRLLSSVVLYGTAAAYLAPAVGGTAPGSVWIASPAGSAIPLTPAGFSETRPESARFGVNLTRLALESEAAAVICVANGASFEPAQPLAPGQLVTLFGDGLGPPEVAVPDPALGAVPAELAGVQVRFDGVPAPLLAVSARQINVVAPFAIEGREATRIEVDANGVRVAELVIPVRAANPGVLIRLPSEPPVDRFSLLADAFNEDGAVNSDAAPAAYKSVIEFFATGFGRLEPASDDGSLAGGLRPAAPVRVLIGGYEAEVIDVATVEGRTNAVLRVRARVPDVCCGGRLRIDLRVGDQGGVNGPIISVR